ncbi:T9SS type A sorting domain-containing protein [Aureisphaera galaxeae]|uniref:T9SS type A sorting domain-containing protein n=1 Tax=Aureisphaera galaxeae TaxID=1538023 RepID=UPI00234FC355|nr:T9SS type A sorting domain-containing protein [Aureisphaera galaxeae]MDC8005401.1 T9SS type A sorting domain-containing protein [Aureisphaera galaxeae]
MRTYLVWGMLAISAGLLAQVTVSTVTPEMKGSGGLSFDSDGNLIIADFGDFLSVSDPDGQPNDIWSMDTDFNLSLYSTGFVGASGNDFDSNGVLFQSDIGASAIYKIVNGVRTFVTSTGIVNPVGIAFDSNDNFFVCNCGNNTIRKVTPAGVSTLFASGAIFQCPNGITVDEDDNLYVSNFSNGNIIKITPTGETTLINVTPGGSTSGPSNGHLEYYEPTRTLFIASHGSNTIYYLRLDDSSQLHWLAGSGVRGNDDGDAAVASFSRPNGVAITQTGDSIYINSAIPLTNVPNGPLNPQVIRLIKGVNSVLSVNDVVPPQLKITVFPNPTQGQLTIEAFTESALETIDLQLYDLLGRKVKEIKDTAFEQGKAEWSLDVSDLQSGQYFFTLTQSGKQWYTGKVLKQ